MLLPLAPSTCFTCFLSALLGTFAKTFVLLVFSSTVNMVTAVKETSHLIFPALTCVAKASSGIMYVFFFFTVEYLNPL